MVRPLQDRQVELRRRRLLDGDVADVGDHSDDLQLVVAVHECLQQRILTGPQPLGERLVDEGHRDGACVIT